MAKRGEYSERIAAFGGGAVVGTLGGLIGLGGAEFRLPLLIGLFRFNAIEAVILNKAMSLLVVGFALLARSNEIPFDALGTHWPIIVNVLAGSLFGAWIGADIATRLSQRNFYRVIAVLLAILSVVLCFGHDAVRPTAPLLQPPALTVAAAAAGVAIGLVASLLGVAGGEFIIPTLILLFGVDIKLAGSLSLAISLPTMIVAMARYSRDDSFRVLDSARRFLFAMGAGSVAGAVVGGLLLGFVPAAVLLPLLAAVLLVSAVKIWRHRPVAASVPAPKTS